MSENITSEAKRLELIGGTTVGFGFFFFPSLMCLIYHFIWTVVEKKVLPVVQLNIMKHFPPPLHILFYAGLAFEYKQERMERKRSF